MNGSLKVFAHFGIAQRAAPHMSLSVVEAAVNYKISARLKFHLFSF